MASSLLQPIGRDAPEQVKRRRMLVENQSRALLQGVFQRGEAEDEAGQLGILLEDRQRFGGFGLALALDLRSPALAALASISAALRSASERMRCASASPSYWNRSASTFRSEVIRSNTDWLTFSGSCSRLMPRNSTSKPEVVGADLRPGCVARISCSMADEAGPIVGGGDEIGQRMPAHHGRLGVAQPLVQQRFRRRDRDRRCRRTAGRRPPGQ